MLTDRLETAADEAAEAAYRRAEFDIEIMQEICNRFADEVLAAAKKRGLTLETAVEYSRSLSGREPVRIETPMNAKYAAAALMDTVSEYIVCLPRPDDAAEEARNDLWSA